MTTPNASGPLAGPARIPASDLTGRRALVTGGASGIGLAVAHRLVGAGASVRIVGRSRDRLDGAVGELGEGATGVCADVGDEAQVAALFTGEPVDILVTCAGAAIFGAVDAATLDQVRAMFEPRFFGQLAAVHHAVPRMPAGGVIVLVSGVADVVGTPEYTAGAALDGGINAFARAVAVEVGPRGLRVNAVSPGVIDSGITPTVGGDLAADFAERARAATPLRRAGTPDDVADAVWFLVTSPYISGQVIEVDGGWSAT